MDTIKLLDKTIVGMPLIITTKWQDITHRSVSIYAGTEGDGIYNFIDKSGWYKATAGYIREHITIDNTLYTDEDIAEVAKLNKKIGYEKIKAHLINSVL